VVRLWRGFHHAELVQLLKVSWQENHLVLLIPSYLQDFSFLKTFALDQVSFHGDWPAETREKALAQGARELSAAEIGLRDQAVLGVFTSGTSSGSNRLVLYSRENILASLTAIRRLYDTARIKKIFSYPQPTHTFGLVLGYMHAVLHQLEIHFSEGGYGKSSHSRWWSTVDENTLTLGAPTHFMDLIQWVQSQGLKPPPSYSAILGGALVTKDLWWQLKNILNISEPSIGYGATEASPGVTHLPPGCEPQEDGDIGFALDGVKMRVESEEGVVFQGANVCLAILENGTLVHADEILLRDRLIVDVCGDKNRYTYIGRTDLVINRGGVKVSLEVIEGKLATSLNCKCMAVSLYDPRLGEDLGILLQTNVPSSDVREKALALLAAEWSLKISLDNILITQIPLNPNGKHDRKEGAKLILKTRSWSFPVSIEHLKIFLPHRPPAIWVDRLLETRKHFGEVKVIINENANYFSKGRIRETACVEWVAQAYGYTAAMNDILDINLEIPATKTYIVEAKTCDFFFDDIILKTGDEVRVQTLCTHDFGVLKVVQGKVFWKENELATMSLKLYCG
jgi:hypothetical protein